MENFEYSIQLNDQDWAEFYLASEECSLIQPALATADEQLLSDLEEGEAEEIRLIGGRVGPLLAHEAAGCLSRGAPDTHLLAEDLLSGSEDEIDLGSVSRFLCNDNQSNTAFPLSSWTQESQPSSVTLKPLGSQCGMARPAAGSEAVFSAREGESEIGDWPRNPDCSSPAVIVSSIQERDLQKQSPGKEAAEGPVCMSLDAPERIGGTAGENGSDPISLQLQPPQNDVSQNASAGTQLSTSADSNVTAENSEALLLRDPVVHPSSPCFSSLLPTQPEEAKDPEKSAKHLQIVLMAQSTPFHKNSSTFQGYSGTVNLAPSNQLLESHEESTQEWMSKGGEDALNSKGEKEDDCSNSLSHGILKERNQVGQVGSSPCDNVASLFPGGLEGNKCVKPTQEADTSSDEKLGKRRETASPAGKGRKGYGREVCCSLGMAEPFDQESHPTIQGRQASDFGEESVPFCLISQGSPETQEEQGNRWEGTGEEGPVSYTVEELPSMYGPEMYEYFFNDIDEVHVSKDSGDKATTPKTFLSSGHQSAPPNCMEDPDSENAGDAMHITIPEVYEYFFDNSARGKRNWRGIFLSMPASEARKAARALKSLICRHARRVRSQPTNHGDLLRRGSQGTLVLLSPVLLAETQPRQEDLQLAVMEPERPLQLVLTNRDMCLGFVAFASWAVKTSDLQAPDAWKIVLLANFGTLSAIRYFRRQVITEGQHGT